MLFYIECLTRGFYPIDLPTPNPDGAHVRHQVRHRCPNLMAMSVKVDFRHGRRLTFWAHDFEPNIDVALLYVTCQGRNR